MRQDSLLLGVAVVAVLVSLAGVGFTYYTVNEYKNTWLTGYVSEGDVNLTVQDSAAINFTVDSINWGTGQVDSGSDNATLNTCCGGSVTGGNWTIVSQGFVVENIGNVNITFNLAAGQDADGFIGGTAGGGPEYQYNVTNSESSSCTNATAFNLGQFYDVNITGIGTRICEVFQFADSLDELRIDVRLVVPSDSNTGDLSDTMTATISAA